MTTLYPLQFRPVFRRYIWGGRRFESLLHKAIGPGCDWAESWEICDLGPDQSIVEAGALTGLSLSELMARSGKELLGRHYPQSQFPLLLKYLDARRTLSVQVHPGCVRESDATPSSAGKSEVWVILESTPESQIYAGLKPGVDRPTLTTAICEGRCQDYLHAFHPVPGDCVYLPAGTIHALGEGVVVVELQQPSDVTYRLFDWNRVGPDGKPRMLHVEQGLDVVDFRHGPVTPRQPVATERRQVSQLLECEHFVWDRWDFDSPLMAGGDDRCHVLTVLSGAVEVAGDASGCPLSVGNTIMLAAALGKTELRPLGRTVLLDGYLP